MHEDATVAATSEPGHRTVTGDVHAWRDSNPRVTVLETAALPLSYGRIFRFTARIPSAPSRDRTCDIPIKSRELCH